MIIRRAVVYYADTQQMGADELQGTVALGQQRGDVDRGKQAVAWGTMWVGGFPPVNAVACERT